MSSSSWRRVFAAAVAAVAALSLSGCGASQPGAAAKVGDQTVTASDVNRLTDGYCAAFEPQFKADGTVLPMQVVRGYVAGTMTVNAAAQQLAASYGITEPEGYVEATKNLETQAAGLPAAHRDEVLEVENAGAYTNAVETQVGGLLLADEGKTDADDATKASRGREAMQEWLGENHADVNPRYGIGIANGTFTDVDNDTSYPLSANAVAAGKSQPDQAYAATLPSNQRCG